MEINCSIFKSLRHHEMYLYTQAGVNLETLPTELMERFGRYEHVMDLTLNEQRKLARENVFDVIESIEKHGFYLQIPPKLSDCVARTIERIEIAENALSEE
ncbi:YcgL domain-containing protein [Piscirickettsia litoralis]|uniref:YcgL domain-containing protein BGC07_09155 n=1 Tax=Piscirickettsia litoralis TaxID=1891921 RepID=A0ABX3A3M0_9GAMM|nr:YcgL domain-containing protein [Piscirickettsia litoralis]ODN43053.1 hypothetical protein BGC07_09155 [Piscirickettsia litoralis]